MFIPKHDKMASYHIFVIRYSLCFLDTNEIGDEGCEHLSKANWNAL